jgi:hypothetical protein
MEPIELNSHSARRFGPRTRNHSILGSIVLLLVLIVGVANGFGSFGWAWIVLVLPGWFILDDVVTAIRITPEAVRITTAMGRPSRTIRFEGIERVRLGKARAGPQGAPRAAVALDLIPKRGRRLRVVPDQFAGFSGSDGWAALLKTRFVAHQVRMDTNVADALADAASG